MELGERATMSGTAFLSSGAVAASAFAAAAIPTIFWASSSTEDAEAWEIAQLIATDGRWYDRSDRDYDFEIVREAGARDVLTYQRLTKREQQIVDSVTHSDGTPIHGGDFV